MARLYEIGERYRNLADMLDDDSIPAEAVLEALDGLEEEFTAKAQAVAKLVLDLDAEAEAAKTEAARLSNRKRAAENKAQRLKGYIQQQMESIGLQQLRGDVITLRVQDNPPKVVVDDPARVPESYYKPPAAPELDRAAVLAALRAGEEVPGCRLETGRSLRIR